MRKPETDNRSANPDEQTKEYGLEKLVEKRCKPCEGGVDPLPRNRVNRYLEQLPGWKISFDRKSIGKKFEFKGFFRTMSFIRPGIRTDAVWRSPTRA